jgi:hypothetical protein
MSSPPTAAQRQLASTRGAQAAKSASKRAADHKRAVTAARLALVDDALRLVAQQAGLMDGPVFHPVLGGRVFREIAGRFDLLEEAVSRRAALLGLWDGPRGVERALGLCVAPASFEGLEDE